MYILPSLIPHLLEHVSDALVEITFFLSDWKFTASSPYSRPCTGGERTNTIGTFYTLFMLISVMVSVIIVHHNSG